MSVKAFNILIILTAVGWAFTMGACARRPVARYAGAELRWDSDATILLTLPREVITDSAGVMQHCWRFADDPRLWRDGVPAFTDLARYRRRVKELVPDTSPLALIAENIRLIGPSEKANEPILAGRLGAIRAMNALETHLFAYEARRFDMLDHPTEFHAFILRKSSPAGDSVAVYFMAGNQLFPPKPRLTIEAIERDTANGWRLWGHLHNHTFDFTPGKGWLAVTAPSNSDLQFHGGLVEDFGMEYALVTNGFNTIELRADEVRGILKSEF